MGKFEVPFYCRVGRKEEIKGMVSVIIPNHDRDIQELLKSLNGSTYKNIEILEINLGLERSVQRNIGIGRARGEFLLFLDSDQSVSPELIGECVELMKISCCSGIYVPEIIKAKGLFGVIRRWERGFYTGTAIDVVRFVRAKDCPRFDETMSGPEDSDFDRRVLDVKLTSRNPLYHKDGISIAVYFRKKAYYSKSMHHFIAKYPDDKILDWKWRCFGVFFEEGKWKRVLRRPDLFLCVMLLLLLRGVVYLWKK